MKTKTPANYYSTYRIRSQSFCAGDSIFTRYIKIFHRNSKSWSYLTERKNEITTFGEPKLHYVKRPLRKVEYAEEIECDGIVYKSK